MKADFQTDRDHRGLILGKRPSYFRVPSFAWPEMLEPIVERVPMDGTNRFSFVAAYKEDESSVDISNQGLRSIGLLTPEAWFGAVAKSKLMVSTAARGESCV